MRLGARARGLGAHRPHDPGHEQRHAGERLELRCPPAQQERIAERGQLPQLETLAGVVLLVAGVVWAVRTQPSGASAEAHPN